MTKKNLALIALFFMGLAACIYEYPNNDNASLPGVYPAMLEQCESAGGLRAAVFFSNGFSVGFMLRNETGIKLYYGDDFRVDSVQMSNYRNRWGVQFINHGNTKEGFVNWPTPLPTGIYIFEQDFFLDENLAEFYTTLTFTFVVIGWYHFTESREPAPEDLQAMQNAISRKALDFRIAGGASEIIVLASEVAVSRTEVAFNTANLSTQPFMHGLDYLLLVYENGWKPAPTIIDGLAWSTLGIEMRGGEVIDDRFNFEWLFGALANGRYMILRQHLENHDRRGAFRVQEILMVEFVIDDSTPISLEECS